jgi:hypothetical protein
VELWGRSFSELQKRFAGWSKFDEAAKHTIYAKLQGVVEEMPLELMHKLTTKIAAEIKARKKEEGK